MIGYDIDGVLTTGIKPEQPYVVISGRLVDEWQRTVQEIGVAAPIYLRPSGVYGDRKSAGEWKAEIIRRLQIEVFYEDDPVQAGIIRSNCSNCKVILLGTTEAK